MSDMSSKQVGKDNPWYTNGSKCGFEKKSQHEFHEKIRARDNYTCQDCGKAQEQSLSEANRRLDVHHKDGDHFNNTDENAVTLCCDCHLVYSKQQHLEDEQRKTLAASLVACDVEKIKEMLGDLI